MSQQVPVEAVLETLSEDMAAVIAKQARELAIAKVHIAQLTQQGQAQAEPADMEATE